jgi:hypothetical protein
MTKLITSALCPFYPAALPLLCYRLTKHFNALCQRNYTWLIIKHDEYLQCFELTYPWLDM